MDYTAEINYKSVIDIQIREMQRVQMKVVDAINAGEDIAILAPIADKVADTLYKLVQMNYKS
jgi:hypothetical protein